MTKFDEMFADYILNQSQFDPDIFTAILPDPTNIRKNHDQSPEPEPTDMKEDIAELSDDAVKQIYEILGVEPPMTIKWGAEHPDDSIRFHAYTKEHLKKVNTDANAILNLLHKLGYSDVPIRPILELIGAIPV